jgi:replicative superfamily II helicase
MMLVKLLLQRGSRADIELWQGLILQGIAFHHSGLDPTQRSLIEDAFRASTLHTICCTPTLSTGVNLPASVVIIRSTKFGDESLSSEMYKVNNDLSIWFLFGFDSVYHAVS